jgi:2-oxoisovalerate dehydrogenase E1 component beta subunit
LTVLAYGAMVHVAQAAALESGVDAEVIDLRSLWPLDLDTLVASVKKTGRCVIVHEATRTSGFGAELIGADSGALFLPSGGTD